MSVNNEIQNEGRAATVEKMLPQNGVYASLFDKINLTPVAEMGGLNGFEDNAVMAETSADERVTAAVQVFMQCLHKSGQKVEKLDKTLLDHHIAELDFQISRQLDEVMHNDAFQKVESVWRGLKSLVDKTDFRQNVKLEILDLSKEELRQDFEDSAEIVQSGLYKQTYIAEYDTPGGEPIAAVISAYEFDATAQDVALMRNISKVSAAAHMPFIGSAGPKFFLKESMEEVAAIKDISNYFDRAEYIKWQSFRDTDDPRYIGLVMPRVLGRLPYGPDIPGEGVRIWRESSAPSSIVAWVTTGGSPAMQQQVLMNSLMNWFHQHVKAVFMDENPDVPAIAPTAVLWGMGPILAGSLATSAWTAWLSRHTAMQQVAGWQPVGTDSTVISPFPDFILPLLPEGRGLTPRGRAFRCALWIFTLAAIAALLSSGWNNRQLLQRVSFDIARYDRIPMHDFGPKADAVAVLRDDAAELDDWARNGIPARMGLGLYQGERLRMPVLDAIRSWVPPPPPPEPQPKPKPVPKIVRLDSMSLFDSGKSVLKAGSTKMLVNSLVGVKAKPGWLIVVAGHTDNTGTPQLNQPLSLKRAAAVRDWMRDTGDLPESCFAVQGYGESRPVATNDTADGRALNRRVEISLVPQANACQLPGEPTASSQDDDVSQH